jgi:parallel beta-helix repeat protein
MERKGKMKKISLGILLATLSLSMLFSAFDIQSVKAAGTIYITADGSISPPEAPISSLDNITYTLTGNVTDSIVVERSNIVVDGAGYSVEGDGTGNGFSLQNIVNVTIENTRIEGCIDGIQLFNSSNSIITGNSLVGSSYEGVGLYYSSDNIISDNSITDNQVGIGFYDSSNNLIFHNSFANNAYQVHTETSVNVLDKGYPSGGNYWNDYSGVDSNEDGIGDTPYPIDENNQDRYPLMKPWTNIVISEVTSPRNIIGQGYASYIYVSVQNQGWNTETIDITIYANTTPIIQEQMILASRSSVNATLIWDSSSLSKGNYTISAYAQPVSGETDMEDNNCPGGWILIAKVGDLGGGPPPTFFACDGEVDAFDFTLWKACYDGIAPPNAMYLGDLGTGPPPTFFACDEVVDAFDFTLWKACYDGLGPDT